MDNDAISKDHHEDTLENSKQITGLKAKDEPYQEKISSKQQATQNSDNAQNKFDLPSFKCEVCSYESIWKHAVKRHQQTHYKGEGSTEEKKFKYKCETCSYMTNNWSILKEHQKMHVSPNRKIETNVPANKDLPKQSITEQKEKPLEKCKNNHQKELNKTDIYTCRKCKYKTSDKVIFENHKKIHLQNKEKEVFRCDFCSFNSIYRQSFLRHMRTMHGNELRREGDVDCIEQVKEHIEMFKEKKKVQEMIDQNGKKISSVKHITYLQDDHTQSQNNNLPYPNPMKSHEVMIDPLPNKSPPNLAGTIRQPIARTRRGKYSDVPVKMTKNGLFECDHCSYQTAIRTALVKHQKNHLKNANS